MRRWDAAERYQPFGRSDGTGEIAVIGRVGQAKGFPLGQSRRRGDRIAAA